MSLKDYTEAVTLMEAHPSKQDFDGPKSEQLISKAEAALGFRFPSIYRRFLREFGVGNFGSAEICGVVREDFEHSSVPDAVWYTLSERRQGGLPPDVLIIGEDGMGGLFCLECGADQGRVVRLPPGRPLSSHPREPIANDFGEFFLELVRRQISR